MPKVPTQIVKFFAIEASYNREWSAGMMELWSTGKNLCLNTPLLQYSSVLLSHLAFENFQAVVAVHQVEQPVIAPKNIVALDRFLAFPGLWNIVTHFFGT